MKNFTQWLSVFAILILAGCSGDKESAAMRDNGTTGSSRVSDENVFSSPVKSLERAERVEQIVLDHKKSIDSRLQ